MSDPWTENQPGNNTEKEAMPNWVVRAIAFVLWCFDYVGIMWFYDYRSTSEKIIGIIVLILGLVAFAVPVRVIGLRLWKGILYAFYLLSLLLILMVKFDSIGP